MAETTPLLWPSRCGEGFRSERSLLITAVASFECRRIELFRVSSSTFPRMGGVGAGREGGQKWGRA